VWLVGGGGYFSQIMMSAGCADSFGMMPNENV
jgi:hypothetical protein